MRTRRAALLLAAAGAVGVSLAYRRRANRRERRKLTVAIIALLALSPRIDIDLSPETIIGGISGFFAAVVQFIIGDIVTPIAQALSWLGSHAIGYINDLNAVVWNVLGDVRNAFGSVGDWINAVWQNTLDAFNYLRDTIPGIIYTVISGALDAGGWLLGLLTPIVRDIVNGALGIGGELLAALIDAVNGILNDALDVGNWLWHRILNIAETAIRDALAVGGAIYGAIADIVGTLIGEWLQLGGWLYDRIAAIIEDVVRGLLDVAGDVLPDILKWIVQNAEAVLRFLVFVVEHPFDWFVQGLQSAFDVGRDAIVASVLDGLDANGDALVDFLDRHL